MPPQDTELRILGPCELAATGSPVSLGSPKQRVLLACLVAELNRPVTIERLVTAVWAGTPPAAVETTLRSLVSRLRRLLVALPMPEGQARIEIVAQDGAYLLRADPGSVDARRFEEDLAAGRRALSAGDPLEAVHCFTSGLARWRGPALSDLVDFEPARPEAHRLDEARLAAIEFLADAHLAAGDPLKAQATMESMVADHPLREAAWGRLMLALYRQGRQADALRVYQRARRLLVEELGVEPGPELRKLEQQVLAQSPELEGPAAPVHNMVAFLFTDIEASTRRWEGDRQAMATDLARHDEVLRSEVERAGGRVFAHTGDGLCASFPTAADGVGAAVAGQRALLRQLWESPEPLRVRMAVHAGAAESRGDNWVGPSLNRTARLLNLAAGGQILCSRAAADLAGDELPPAVLLRDLGEHRLADLTRPEQVFAVEHPDLPTAFSVLPGTGVRRSNLIEPLTSFLGRAGELDELEVLLSSARILTITGVGGAGKTRLAIELARRCLDRYPDGVWLVELASLRDPAGLVDDVAGALGLVASAAGRDRLAQVREWLAARRLLIVLDNCEHVVEAVAKFLEAVLPVAPGLSVLATSREVLALPGEVSWAVPPLSLPPPVPTAAVDLAGSDAVELFCHRARSAQPAFALNDGNAAPVAQICRRLDGIPLALELAAGRIRVLGAHQLAERLDDRFRILAGTARGGTTRHQTLQATIDWSWNLLPTREREALRRLSVFPATFDLDAAEAVITNTTPDRRPADAAELVLRLVDKSLVVAASDRSSMRYRLLETIRSYAAARLAESDEEEPAREAHCEHLLRLADAGAVEGYWMTEERMRCIGDDEAGFVAALDWSLRRGRRTDALRLMAGYWPYVLFSDRIDLVPLLDRCLADPLPPPSAGLVECLAATWMSWPERGVGAVNEELLSAKLRATAEELGDDDVVARTGFFVGAALASRCRVDEGRAMLLAGREHFARRGWAVACAWFEPVLGWIHMLEGDLEGATEWFERAGGVGDRLIEVQAWGGLAMVAALAGQTEAARHHLDNALDAAHAVLPMRRFHVMVLCRATEIGLLTGDEPMAAEFLDKLLVTLRELGILRWVAGALEATVSLLPPSCPEEAAILARLLAAAETIRLMLGEIAPLPTIPERLAERRREIAGLLDSPRIATESDHGGRASADEALRWALAALRSREARRPASV